MVFLTGGVVGWVPRSVRAPVAGAVGYFSQSGLRGVYTVGLATGPAAETPDPPFVRHMGLNIINSPPLYVFGL